MTTTTAAGLLRQSLDAFLAKDMKGRADLCAHDVVAEFATRPSSPSAMG